MKTTYKYRVYGLTIESVLELPDLIPASSGIPDVQIKTGDVPDALPNPIDSGVFYQATKNDFLFKLEDVGVYRVQNGCEITVKALGSPEDIRVFLLGSAIGALLHQKGILAIHGSAIATDAGAIIISGKSSAGKSSLAASLVKRGYGFIADDIASIYKSNNELNVHPGIPHIKLWKDVVQNMKIKDKLPKVRNSIEKFKNPVGSQFKKTPTLVKTVIILSDKNSPGFEIKQIKGAEKFELLNKNTYRSHFIKGLQTTEFHFDNISSLASAATIFQIKRPSSPLQIEELSDFVVKEIIDKN